MTYIKRHIDSYLEEWKDSPVRKPLLLRGARQIGKSSSVREFGKQFDFFLEINFDEKDNEIAKTVFERYSSPQKICDELSLIYNIPIVPKHTLLFLDEIQACIPGISSLRYFYENMPELHIIAAGSLLEFALEEVPSFGVGRIRSMFMHPLSFDEYLRAMGFSALADRIKISSPENPLSEPAHQTALQHLIRFILIGGMPQVVATYAQTGRLYDCRQVLDDIVLTYYDDFAKYKKRVPVSRLRAAFSSIIEQTGRKFVYSAVSQTDNHEQIKQSIELLILAGIVYPVTHSAATGIPLAAQTNPKFRKFLIFDTGIMQRFLDLDISQILLGDTLEQINKGAIAELFAGLELIKSASPNNPQQLYYWQRETRGSQAEIDYVIRSGTGILPIEVKSGTKGAMQSLRIFMEEKNIQTGVRCSLENFGLLPGIRIYPLYAAGQIKSSN